MGFDIKGFARGLTKIADKVADKVKNADPRDVAENMARGIVNRQENENYLGELFLRARDGLSTWAQYKQEVAEFEEAVDIVKNADIAKTGKTDITHVTMREKALAYGNKILGGGTKKPQARRMTVSQARYFIRESTGTLTNQDRMGLDEKSYALTMQALISAVRTGN